MDRGRRIHEILYSTQSREELAKRIVGLEEENAKLRELLRDMWREGAFEPGACYEKAAERLEERTRELGIEVDL